MPIWFIVSIAGMLGVMPLYAMSLEHLKLKARYGPERGRKRGALLGIISGWGFFLFWTGIWISPQPRFHLPYPERIMTVPVVNTPVAAFNLMVFLIVLAPAVWFGIAGVQETGLKTSETHRATRIVTTGLYSKVRHPQYLGGLLAHAAFTVLLSGLYSLIAFPAVIALVFLLCRKEEAELIHEFGDVYRKYRKRVPMLIPRPGKSG